MTDETTTTEATETATPAAEEPTVNLAEEAAKGLESKTPAKAQEVMQELTQELTPELIEKVNKLVESKTGSALDGQRRKLQEDFEKRIAAEGYMTPEQVQKQIEENQAFAERKAAAAQNLDRTLGSLGVQHGTDAYKKVEQAFAKGLEEGVFTHQTLLSETGIKSIAYAAGVLQPEAKQEEATRFLGSGAHTRVPSRSKEYKPGDLDAEARANMMKALEGEV